MDMNSEYMLNLHNMINEDCLEDDEIIKKVSKNNDKNN